MAVALVVATIASVFLPDTLGVDWRLRFRPAALHLLAGGDPYQVDQFFLAPWVFVLLAPLSVLSEKLGMGALFTLGLCAYAYTAYRLRAKPLGIAALLLSPQVLHNLINGNLDWLALLGFVLPPQVGLFFLAIKPQIGIALAAFWAVEALREKRFLKTFGPFLAVMLLSLVIFGPWPLAFSNVEVDYNASAWPISLPFGLVLLFSALYRRKERIAQAISPLLAPHVMFHSWVAVLYALAPNTAELVAAVIASWLFVGLSVVL